MKTIPRINRVTGAAALAPLIALSLIFAAPSRAADESWDALVALCQQYNRHLLHVMARVPGDQLSRRCVIGDNDPVTLEFLMKDYVVHLKHHLEQILG